MRQAEKIRAIIQARTPVISSYRTEDTSVQAELRLSAEWSIRLPLDEIHYPKRLGPSPNSVSVDSQDPWHRMWRLAAEAQHVASLVSVRTGTTVISINAKTKTGPERRAEAKATWEAETGKRFLVDYKAATGKCKLAAARKRITEIQAEQKALLPQLREINSRYLAGKREQRESQATINTEALKSGQFWLASKDALKDYFHPPFGKNFLADVSERWRAALFLECESESYKRYNDEWGHKLVGTGRGYLCGIDDNGDEWGHRVNDLYQGYDEFGSRRPEGTVEEAMSILFDISQSWLKACERQGDLLFCRDAVIPEDVTLTHEATWTPRESHKMTSPSLRHNGRYFAAEDPITITHTSHATVTLPAGSYELYPLQVRDAD